jgi:hypothetical protein
MNGYKERVERILQERLPQSALIAAENQGEK